MRIVFMGNPSFSVPSLQAIHDSGHNLVAVVSNPDQPVGRGRKLVSSAVSEAAGSLNLPLIQTDSLHDPEFHRQLEDLEADFFIVVAYKILPKSVLAIPRLGSINLHGSILPRYRGAAPIQWALINGDQETGLTTFLIKPSVDTGDILKQQTVAIDPGDDFGSLSYKMEQVGAQLIVDTLDDYSAGNIKALPQEDMLASKAPKITKETCVINWSEPAADIHNLIRGLSPYPGAYTILGDRRLKIFKSSVDTVSNSNFGAGLVIAVSDEGIIIQTGEGQLTVLECQIEGKRRMETAVFLRGINIAPGDKFGS